MGNRGDSRVFSHSSGGQSLPWLSLATVSAAGGPTLPAKAQGEPFTTFAISQSCAPCIPGSLEAALCLQSWQHSILPLLAVATSFCSQISPWLTPTRNPCDGT